MTAYEDLESEVAAWVADQLEGPLPSTRVGEVEIRDPVQGFEVLRPYEVALLDTRLVQRLRRIHQTALAYLVYPAARHSRLEHSLGVLTCAQRMGDALARKHNGLLTEEDFAELRLAGLLHDIGHGPFSHLSERIFSLKYAGELQAIQAAKPEFRRKSLGEILSYTIVTSAPFKDFFEKLKRDYSVPDISLERIAGYFLGHVSDKKTQFKADIISGALDADKLDYFARDCYFSGIRAEIDVERMLLIIDVDTRSSSPSWQLVIDRSGVHHMEHVIFSKMQLFSSVYHHHTIRGLECGVSAMFEAIWDDPSGIGNADLRFPSIGSLLRMGEDEFWVLAAQEERLAGLTDALWANRVPLKRALALGMATIEPNSTQAALELWKVEAYPVRHREIAKAIGGSTAGYSKGLFGVWWDMPSEPAVSGDATKTMVRAGAEFVPLDQFFPAADWVAAYSNNNLMAHVFTDDDGHRRDVTASARKYFLEQYDVHCKELAVEQCYKD